MIFFHLKINLIRVCVADISAPLSPVEQPELARSLAVGDWEADIAPVVVSCDAAVATELCSGAGRLAPVKHDAHAEWQRRTWPDDNIIV